MLYLALLLSNIAPLESHSGSAVGFLSSSSLSDIPSTKNTNSVAFLRTNVPKRVPSTMQTIRGHMQVRSKRCIVIASPTDEMLIIWPSDARLETIGEQVSVSVGKWIDIKAGDAITLGGSGSGPARVTRISGVIVPEECRKYPTFIVGEGGVLDKTGR